MTVGGILPALPAVATEHFPEATPVRLQRQIISNSGDATPPVRSFTHYMLLKPLTFSVICR
jgi:hypothetical protein